MFGGGVALVLPASGQDPCPDPDDLAKQAYTVSKVRIRTPLWFSSPILDRLFFGKIEDAASDDLAALPIQAGQRFSRAN